MNTIEHQGAMGKFTTLSLVLLMTLALMMPAGCNHHGHSTLGATVAGRAIKASIDGPAGISTGKDAATIRFGNHQISVEKARLLIDGKESAKLPASATNVTVVVSNAKVTVTADGVGILREQSLP